MKLDRGLSYSCIDGVLECWCTLSLLVTNTSIQRLCTCTLKLIEQGKREAKEIMLSTKGIGAYGTLCGYLLENFSPRGYCCGRLVSGEIIRIMTLHRLIIL